MNIDRNMASLICELEYLIGSQTYNPNSYNGWTGEEGCGFKYPVNYCKNKEELDNHNLTKTKFQIDQIAPECIGTMKYAFGSNHLYIGDGLVEVLEHLEDLYGIDFNQLEKERVEKKKEELNKLSDKIEKGEQIRIESGKQVVGIDIPVGSYKIVNLRERYSNYLSIDICDENGYTVDHIFSDEDQIDVKLNEGYVLKSYDVYALIK